jgi:hypothetical protein
MPEDSFDKKVTEKFDKATVRQAEKLIDSSAELKAARSIKDGLKPLYGQTHGGKGSAPRTNTFSDDYQDKFDRIFKQGKYAQDKDKKD